MMSEYKIEVFRTGIHTAMNGETFEYSQADIDAMAALYNEQTERKAPLVIGHPNIDDPAYGWVDKLLVEGDRMFAVVSQVSDKVIEAVRAGMFKMVSVALWPDKLLRHVGLLGAAAPAVAGLAPVQFAADDKDFLEFAWATAENRMPIVGTLLRNLRDFFIEQFGKDKADTVLDSYSIDRLQAYPDETYIEQNDDAGGLSVYSAPKTKEEIDAMDEVKLQEIEGKYSELEAKFAALVAKNTELEAGLAVAVAAAAETKKQSAAEVATAEFATMLSGLIVDGKVLPAEQDAIISEFKDMYRASAMIQYAEGEVPLVSKFTERLKARPVVIAPTGKIFATRDNAAQSVAVDASKLGSEFAAVAGSVDLASLDLDQKIEAYAAANNVSYEVAAAKFGAAE